MDGYDTTGAAGAAYDPEASYDQTGDGAAYDDAGAVYDAAGAGYDAAGAGYDNAGAEYDAAGAGYDAGDASYETGGDASYETAGGVADNVEIKTESDEDDDLSNLIMVANDDDDDGYNDEDADGEADPDDPDADGDQDRDPLSDEDQDPLVIDEAPTHGPGAGRRGKAGKIAKQQQRGKLGAKQKNVSKMWKQQRMPRKDKGVSCIGGAGGRDFKHDGRIS